MSSINGAALPRFLGAPTGGYAPPQAPPPAPPAGPSYQAYPVYAAFPPPTSCPAPTYPLASASPPVQAQRGGPELIYAVIVTVLSGLWGKVKAVFTGSRPTAVAPGLQPPPLR